METNGDSDSPGWGASFIMHTSEEIARAVCSSKEDGGGHLQKLQNQVFQVLKGLSQPTEEKSTYNPEVLTTQKRQWDSFPLQALHRRILKEPSRLFESIVVVRLHPNSDIQSGSGRLQIAINGQRQSTLAVTNLEAQGADDSILISTEERLERLRQSISGLDLESSVEYANEEYIEDKACGTSAENGAEGMLKGTTETVRLSRHDSITETNTDDKSLMVDLAAITDSCKQESVSAEPVSKSLDGPVYDIVDNNQPTQSHIQNVILPLLRYQHHDSSESSSSVVNYFPDSSLPLAELLNAAFRGDATLLCTYRSGLILFPEGLAHPCDSVEQIDEEVVDDVVEEMEVSLLTELEAMHVDGDFV
ncbi:hypothetical protein SSX86_004275 [Deinandra increscens subsp. villosa]|uniref:Uncharacterized protein n=1 Tax=Deinandra increscens subsp. villosa TaxID=3103831 RepID=A0AAP0HAS1_9ASTR